MYIRLRKAEKRDWKLILELRNMSFKFFNEQKKRISLKEHNEYMEKQIKNSNFHQWVIEFNKIDVGYVRILDSDVSIMIYEEYQNKGIASRGLKLLEGEAKKLKINKLIAKFTPENHSSKEIFYKNNYKLKMYLYEKKII
jgi:predicted acetyltransferase